MSATGGSTCFIDANRHFTDLRAVAASQLAFPLLLLAVSLTLGS